MEIFSGEEDQNYADIAEHFAFYKVNTIANYDPKILEIIDLPTATVIEVDEAEENFFVVEE